MHPPQGGCFFMPRAARSAFLPLLYNFAMKILQLFYNYSAFALLTMVFLIYYNIGELIAYQADI